MSEPNMIPASVAFELELDGMLAGDAITDALDRLKPTMTGDVVGFITWVRHPATGHAVAESRSVVPKEVFIGVVEEWLRHARGEE